MFTKIINSFLLIISSFWSFAQMPDLVEFSAKYKVMYKENKNTLVNDICQLDITKKQSYFYSLGVIEEANSLMKKIEMAQLANNHLVAEAGEMRRDLYKFNTIKNYSSNTSIVTEFVGGQVLGYVRDTLSNLKWRITDEVKSINSISCRRAEITIGKIKTIAWFSMNIPLQEGPFYYYGLPGLIINLSNSIGWSAELISLTYPKSISKTLDVMPFRIVSKAQFNKAKRNTKSMLKNGIIPNSGSIERVN